MPRRVLIFHQIHIGEKATMPAQFIGKDIQVTTSGEIRNPVSFVLEGREYTIAEILEAWPDSGFGRIPVSRRKWWQRRHRNYYRVRTTDDEIYEIYYDRGVNLENPQYKTWFLTRRY